MGKSSSKERRDKIVKISLGSPKETNSPAGDAKYKGKTPRAPQDSFQEQTDFPNIPTVHSNSFSSSKSTNGTLQTITQVTELSIIDNDTGGFSSYKSTNGTLQTIAQVTELSIIDNDTGGNSENDEQTIPMTKEDKKETKKKKKKKNRFNTSVNMDRCSSKRNETTTGSSQNHDIRPEYMLFANKDYTHFNVNTNSAGDSKSFSSSESTNRSIQTTRRVTEHAIIEYIDIGGNSENYEQTDSITTNEGKETKKKKNKKKMRILTSLMTEPFEPMKAGTTEQGDSGVKDKMRTEPFEPMKAGTTEQGDSGVKDKMRPEPPELMKAETTPYLFKNQDETGVKDKIWSEPSEPMKAETTPYLLKQQDETGVKDEMSVTEQQLKAMTMKAERLTERCRYDIKTSNANDKELKLCLKAFIQSISSVEKYISNLVLENSKLTMEKDEYLNRLSSAAGARLTDNIPNITILHDPNRPMKLAEKFNKIYDDEWTDMIEMLEKKGHNTEEHKDNCVYHLYSVLIVIFKSLSKKAEVQLKGLGKHLFLLTKPSTEQINATWYDYKEERVQLIASRKKTAETTILMLYQTLQTDPIFLQELCECSPPLDDVMLSDILPSEYFMKCVEICWYFVIQDPPMYVETVSLKGIKIDKDTHKVYTKSGDIVKYHVWPALYLHHQDGTNSPLMGKGVVQPE